MTSATGRAVRLVGSLLAVLIVLALALPAVGRIIQSTSQETHPLPAELTHLVVDGDVGDIRIRAAGPGEEPVAEASLRSSLTRPAVRLEVLGDRTELSDTCAGRWWDNCAVGWDIVVPRDAAVTVGSAVGDITVSDITGPLTVDSSVGQVRATGVGSPTITVRTSVGDVTLEPAVPPDQVTVTSSTGDVRVTVPDDGTGYRVETDSSVGTVTNGIGSDPSLDRLLDLRTSVGDITIRRG